MEGTIPDPKSKYSIRKVDLPDELAHELKKWKLACPKSDHDLVFPSAEGKMSCHENVVKRHFNPALRRAGLRHVSFHSLRHTNASIRIISGQNIKYIQTQLGHSSIKVTMDVYGHLFNDVNFNRQQVSSSKPRFKPLRNKKRLQGFPLAQSILRTDHLPFRRIRWKWHGARPIKRISFVLSPFGS